MQVSVSGAGQNALTLSNYNPHAFAFTLRPNVAEPANVPNLETIRASAVLNRNGERITVFSGSFADLALGQNPVGLEGVPHAAGFVGLAAAAPTRSFVLYLPVVLNLKGSDTLTVEIVNTAQEFTLFCRIIEGIGVEWYTPVINVLAPVHSQNQHSFSLGNFVTRLTIVTRSINDFATGGTLFTRFRVNQLTFSSSLLSLEFNETDLHALRMQDFGEGALIASGAVLALPARCTIFKSTIPTHDVRLNIVQFTDAPDATMGPLRLFVESGVQTELQRARVPSLVNKIADFNRSVYCCQ
jgi:hypothetical protein